MAEIFLLLSSVGLTNILKYATILSWARRVFVEPNHFLKELFSCSMCLGFWSGAVLGIVGVVCFNSYICIFLPFAASCCAQLFDYLIDALLEVISFLKEKNKSTNK